MKLQNYWNNFWLKPAGEAPVNNDLSGGHYKEYGGRGGGEHLWGGAGQKSANFGILVPDCEIHPLHLGKPSSTKWDVF